MRDAWDALPLRCPRLLLASENAARLLPADPAKQYTHFQASLHPTYRHTLKREFPDSIRRSLHRVVTHTMQLKTDVELRGKQRAIRHNNKDCYTGNYPMTQTEKLMEVYLRNSLN